MTALLNQDGTKLTDVNGSEIMRGSTVRDEIFGEGIATGTIPLDRGEGVNVTIRWLGPGVVSSRRLSGCQ